MAAGTGPDAAAISRFLLELHQRSHELGYRAMQRFVFERLGTLIPFDGGLTGAGTVQGGEAHAHDVFVYEMPADLMVSWEPIKHRDRLLFETAAKPGTTVALTTDTFYAGLEDVQDHCARFDIGHIASTALVYAEAGLFWVMSLYRKPSSPAFTEADRITKELISPHLLAASRTARLGELRLLTRVGGGHGQLAAIASMSGLVLEAEPGLVEIMRAEWPRWVGPHVPPELEAALPGGAGRFVGRRIVVRADHADGTRLLHARLRVAADQLTEREREIADAFALGESHREIGDRLQISPATVRRHLANIYEKLGVSSKAELGRMLT